MSEENIERNKTAEYFTGSIKKISIPAERGHIAGVDLLKSVMMALVITDHSFTHHFLFRYYNSFWERISIPIFLILMGFNAVGSFDRIALKKGKELTLADLYTAEYFRKKIRRYVMPYVVLFVLHSIIYAIVSGLEISVKDNGGYDETIYVLFGYTPFWGPGMWFIPVIFGSILFFPFLYYCYRKKPLWTLIGCFILEIWIQIFIYVLYYDVNGYHWYFTKIYFICSILFAASAVGMGMWISDDTRPFTLRNIVIWIAFFPSLLYLIIYNVFDRNPIAWVIGDYHFLTFPYSAVIVMFVLTYVRRLPQKAEKFFGLIGRATYHILLFQIFYFSLIYHFAFTVFTIFDDNPVNYLWYFPLNLTVTFIGGISLYKLNLRWNDAVKARESGVVVKLDRLWFSLSVLYYVMWVIISPLAVALIPIPGAEGFPERLAEFFTGRLE